ncbi:unnamed protein product [Trichogramma brassicae]|uniref:Uncharacterized protein n=1 Tax=Trichogramma brassicae TaxID=86971 RepID=A0A6H5IXK2_9HYME|nr:unnamed protein product [Trichogramma brassicae]
MEDSYGGSRPTEEKLGELSITTASTTSSAASRLRCFCGFIEHFSRRPRRRPTRGLVSARSRAEKKLFM